MHYVNCELEAYYEGLKERPTLESKLQLRVDELGELN